MTGVIQDPIILSVVPDFTIFGPGRIDFIRSPQLIQFRYNGLSVTREMFRYDHLTIVRLNSV